MQSERRARRAFQKVAIKREEAQGSHCAKQSPASRPIGEEPEPAQVKPESASDLSARHVALFDAFDGPPRQGMVKTTSTDDSIHLEILSQISAEFDALYSADTWRLLTSCAPTARQE